MIYLEKILINNFRCFEKKEIFFSKHLNIIKGENGSGKTSILEAIYLNLYSKSFKAKNLNSIIKNGDSFTRLESLFKNKEVNTEEKIVFFREKNNKFKGINSIMYKDKKTSVGEIAKLVPIQFINQDDFFILNGSPNNRRKFLDWGVFHVKHNFYKEWKDYSILLKQRNALLKAENKDEVLLNILDKQLIELAKKLDNSRKKYLEIYKQGINEKLSNWGFLKDLSINYYSGWDDKKSFEEVLLKNKKKDMDTGITNNGPHRCDLSFEINNKTAIDVLSRGQQKILIIILKILQGDFLEKTSNKKCIYLIDDLYSELDKYNYEKIITEILKLNNQILLTTKDTFDFKDQKIKEIIL